MMQTTTASLSIRHPATAIRTGLFVAGLIAASAAYAQDWAINWYSIDGGGSMLSESSDSEWQLSGTLGQADASESEGLGGGDWSLTGGFWAISPREPADDRLFSDRFEIDARSAP